MTIVIEDRSRAIAYHDALVVYSKTVLLALRNGVEMERLNLHTLPFNITSPNYVRQYIDCIKKEITLFGEYGMVAEDIGSRIKMARKMARMSQQDLADRLHMSKMAISKMERGQISPIAWIYSIADATGIRYEFFFRKTTIDKIELAEWCKQEKG